MRFAGVSGKFSKSSACSTIEEEMEGLKAAKCKNDLLKFFRENLHEYKQGNPTPLVKGCLREHTQFWIVIGAPEWVLNVIKHGYFIPFESTTPSIRLGNNRLVRNLPYVVSEAAITSRWIRPSVALYLLNLVQ